jgi:hypothetical protein
VRRIPPQNTLCHIYIYNTPPPPRARFVLIPYPLHPATHAQATSPIHT